MPLFVIIGLIKSEIRFPFIERVVLLIPRLVRGNRKWSLLFMGTYSHTWVFRVSVMSMSVTLIPGLLCLYTNNFILTDDGLLFLSLYFICLYLFTSIYTVLHLLIQ